MRSTRSRRALHDAPEPSWLPASYAVMATLWRCVSRSQGVLARRQNLFQNTAAEDRLAEQLYLAAVLHDWRPVTEDEAAELVYLLGLYIEPAADATHEGAAHALNATIRRMAARRAMAGPLSSTEATG